MREQAPSLKKNQISFDIYQILKINLLVEMRILNVKKSDRRRLEILKGGYGPNWGINIPGTPVLH